MLTLVPFKSSFTHGGRGGDQAYSRLSTTHGHMNDCKLDSVAYEGVSYPWKKLRMAWPTYLSPDAFIFLQIAALLRNICGACLRSATSLQHKVGL